jgi:3',5'-cyclic AMP phosphodiesterase CpdA
MSTLVQISDTHFGTEQPNVVEALLTLVRGIGPQVVVLSGDITQRARRAQFAQARRFVEQLGAPRVLAIPGNHDIPLFNVALRAWSPYRNYMRAFGTLLEPELESDAFLVVCVNTTRPSRHKNGEVSPEQIEWVSSRLKRGQPGQVRIVVTHQPVHIVRESDSKNLLHGYRYAVRAWCSAGADIIMGGHIHLPYVVRLREHFKELRRDAWAVQAGTAVSKRIRENIPNSVNVLVHAAGEATCRVERWDFDPSGEAFGCVEARSLSLSR